VTAGGEPGRDDSGLPPVNIRIPDDARELERDVLAYHREVRAKRRRQRLRRIFTPISGPGTALPLIATCMALSLIAGVMLSFLTIGPASAPTRTTTHPSATARPATPSAGARSPGTPATSTSAQLPGGIVQVNGRGQDLRSLVFDVLVLIPGGCGCGKVLSQLVSQSVAARVPVYFVASGIPAPELASLTASYGGKATAVYGTGEALQAAIAPSGVTALLVHQDARADVLRDLRPGASANLGDLRQLLGTP
jgi:hypothetical protein